MADPFICHETSQMTLRKNCFYIGCQRKWEKIFFASVSARSSFTVNKQEINK